VARQRGDYTTIFANLSHHKREEYQCILLESADIAEQVARAGDIALVDKHTHAAAIDAW